LDSPNGVSKSTESRPIACVVLGCGSEQRQGSPDQEYYVLLVEEEEEEDEKVYYRRIGVAILERQYIVLEEGDGKEKSRLAWIK